MDRGAVEKVQQRRLRLPRRFVPRNDICFCIPSFGGLAKKKFIFGHFFVYNCLEFC